MCQALVTSVGRGHSESSSLRVSHLRPTGAPNIATPPPLCSHGHSWEPVSLHATLTLMNHTTHSQDCRTRCSRGQS